MSWRGVLLTSSIDRALMLAVIHGAIPFQIHSGKCPQYTERRILGQCVGRSGGQSPSSCSTSSTSIAGSRQSHELGEGADDRQPRSRGACCRRGDIRAHGGGTRRGGGAHAFAAYGHIRTGQMLIDENAIAHASKAQP
jgi:hypothetical protein